MRARRPEGGGWQDGGRRSCSDCSSILRVRGRVRETDGPDVTLWAESYGFIQVLAWYCPECDPNLLEVLPA